MAAKGAHLIIRDRLTTATGNVAYCAGRVYAIVLPQRPKLPAQTFQVLSAPREHAMNPIGQEEGTVHALVQVDVYDTSYAGTASGGKRVRDALARWRGTASGVVVHDIYVENEFESFEDKLEGARGRVWRRTLDFRVHYDEG